MMPSRMLQVVYAIQLSPCLRINNEIRPGTQPLLSIWSLTEVRSRGINGCCIIADSLSGRSQFSDECVSKNGVDVQARLAWLFKTNLTVTNNDRCVKQIAAYPEASTG